MQNENVRLLVQKEGKSVIKVLEYGAFPFSHSLSLNLSWCFKFAVYWYSPLAWDTQGGQCRPLQVPGPHRALWFGASGLWIAGISQLQDWALARGREFETGISASQGPTASTQTGQETSKDIASTGACWLPGLLVGEVLAPAELPSERAVVWPAQGRDSCHSVPWDVVGCIHLTLTLPPH